MSYLYGDSTPSTLEIDYIEFLRAAVDCCVQVLLADQRIGNGKARLEALEKSSAADLEQIQKAASLVPKAFDGSPLGDLESPAARYAAAVLRSATALASASAAEVQSTLDAAASKAAAEATQDRQTCAEALERLLVKHDLPGMKSEVQIALAAGGHYVGRAHVSTPFGVAGTLELEVPKDHLFERVVRVERLVERLDVQAPEVGGWLHKEIKLRPQHLDKHYIAGLTLGGAGDTLKLRAGLDGTGAGFDLTFAPNGAIRLSRVDEQGKRDDLPFDVDKADGPKLLALRDKLIGAATTLMRYRRALGDARFDGEPLRGHPTPALLAERLVSAIAPTVQEIASRSQSPGELVLRRLIGEARREEIFLSKQELKSKIEPLTERNRALFEPLWLVPPPSAAPPGIETTQPMTLSEPLLAAATPPPPPFSLSFFPPPPNAGVDDVPTRPEITATPSSLPPPVVDAHPAAVLELLDSGSVQILDRSSPTRSSPEVEISLEEHPST